MHICWNTQDILDRIAAMPAAGPLPRRTIVVPRARVAHPLRCGLIERGRLDLLAGTAFVTVKTLAAQVLHAAGMSFREGESRLRLARLRVLFDQGLDPEYFTPRLVQSAPGWEEALVHTIEDLERAGLTPAALQQFDAPAGRGLAQVWQALNDAAGLSLTRAGLVARAAAELERSPALAAGWGAVLALIPGDAEGVEARLIRAIPEARLALRGVRPLWEGYPARIEALFGRAAREAVEEGVLAPQTTRCSTGARPAPADGAAPELSPPAEGVSHRAILVGTADAGAAQGDTPASPVAPTPTDLTILQRYLFEPPEVQAAARRPRAGGVPDGSVVLEEHAGVAAEIEAAADWVVRQVLACGTPLERIAVLVPRLDPLAQLVSDRLRRLPWEGEFPVHVAGSCALSGSSAGGRIRGVLEGLRAHLSVDAVAQVMPLLRGVDESGQDRRITSGAALDLAQSLGTVGGSAADPAGALAWTRRLDRRAAMLADLVERARKAEGVEEQAGLARRVREVRRQRRDLQVVRPGMERLVEVAGALIEGRPLPQVWSLLQAFLRAWVLDGEDEQVLEALTAAVEPACEDRLCRALAGGEALRLIEVALGGLRLPVGRFGEPEVYVGTVRGAVGVPFEAVRVIGLVEGTIPAAPRQDTVLPDDVRHQLVHNCVSTAAEIALRSQHDLMQVVADTTRELVLSTPRLDLHRTYREPSSLFLEVGTALGRPSRGGPRPDAAAAGARPRVTSAAGEGAGISPASGRGRRNERASGGVEAAGASAEEETHLPALTHLTAIRAREFGAARVQAAAYRWAHPVGEAAWQDRAAAARHHRRGGGGGICAAPSSGAAAAVEAPQVPPGWLEPGVLDLARMKALQMPAGAEVMEGILGADVDGPPIPGRARHRPLSASRWQTFLACPHRFLYEHLLGWEAPVEIRSQGELDALAYGSLFHRVLERFFADRGKAFWQQEGSLAGWRQEVAQVARREFDLLLEQYPLAGEGIRRQQLDRLQRELAEFFFFLWRQGPSRFVAAEKPFGYGTPVALAAGEGTLFVRGCIDLIDVTGERTRIWDVKTGRCRPKRGKEAQPTPTVDAQIALYSLVAQQMTQAWEVTSQLQAAYVHTNERAGRTRRFAEDWADLAAAGSAWLAVTADLMDERSFPRTTNADDCAYCPFLPVCGSKGPQRSAARNACAGPALRAFAEMRT